jgi:hypothetical protein
MTKSLERLLAFIGRFSTVAALATLLHALLRSAGETGTCNGRVDG